MMSDMEIYLEEMMEESMQAYIHSEEYLVSENAIDAKISDFESGLNQEQTKAFHQLLDTMSNHYSEFAVRAYKAGVKDGPKYRADATELFGVTLD